MDIVERYGKRKNVEVDGVKTVLILAYIGSPYSDQWNQFDATANIDKNDKKPVMHTAHSLPKNFADMEAGTRITSFGHKYIILD